MKKYCFLFVFLVAALSLRAQIVGDVAVTRKVLAERGGELHMVLEISVSRKAVTRSQSWTILPELSTPDRKSVKLFPHILINGRYQQHMQERRRRLSGAYWAERQPYMTINADKKTDQVFRYEMKATALFSSRCTSSGSILPFGQCSRNQRSRYLTSK